MPPLLPVYRIELRVHTTYTSLAPDEIRAIVEEVNFIWWSQAAICFEAHAVADDQTMQTGFDFWFTAGTIACAPGANGVYCGSDHDIWSVDHPSLGPVNDPMWDTKRNASRTCAHELGHGLRLDHYNGFPDSNDSLMSSGRQGWKLQPFEIQTARGRAAQKALPDTTPIHCNPPQI